MSLLKTPTTSPSRGIEKTTSLAAVSVEDSDGFSCSFSFAAASTASFKLRCLVAYVTATIVAIAITQTIIKIKYKFFLMNDANFALPCFFAFSIFITSVTVIMDGSLFFILALSKFREKGFGERKSDIS